jgi:hypothetical protein
MTYCLNSTSTTGLISLWLGFQNTFDLTQSVHYKTCIGMHPGGGGVFKFPEFLCQTGLVTRLGCRYRQKISLKSLLGTDHLTWRGWVMVFCFDQNFFFGQHKSSNFFFLSHKAQFFFSEFSTGVGGFLNFQNSFVRQGLWRD